jgi:two-component system response regulator
MILLVEDNEDDEALTRRAFKKNQILNELVVVRTGQEALDFLFGLGDHRGRDTRLTPIVMLLDLNLPKVDGFEVLRRVRADPRTHQLRVVVLTSSKQDEDIIKSYTSSANRCVRKPVNFSEFAEAAKALGLFWLLLNHAAPAR